MDEPLETMRAVLDAFNRRDADAFLRWVAPDAEWWPLRSSTEGPYVGREGVRTWFADTAEMFEYIHAEVEEARREGDVMIASGTLHVKGRESGAALDVPVVWVWRYAGGEIVWGKTYTDPAEARAEAGRVRRSASARRSR